MRSTTATIPRAHRAGALPERATRPRIVAALAVAVGLVLLMTPAAATAMPTSPAARHAVPRSQGRSPDGQSPRTEHRQRPLGLDRAQEAVLRVTVAKVQHLAQRRLGDLRAEDRRLIASERQRRLAEQRRSASGSTERRRLRPDQESDPTYYVSVYSSVPYGLAPRFQLRVSPALPPGASLTGAASCSQVYDSGDSGPTESSSLTLDAGVYYFVTNSCTSPSDNQLGLTGVSGPYNLVILGDVDTITPDETALQGAGTEITSPTTVVALAVALNNISFDDSELPGQTVNFYFQTSNGVFENPCTATTTDNGDGVAIATCTLSGQPAQDFVAGTGEWMATYNGAADYEVTSFDGPQLPADTTLAQAAASLSQMKQIQITETAPPPNCETPSQLAGAMGNGGLFDVSIAGFSCSQLQVLQIVTGAIIGVATFVGVPGGSLIIDAIGEVTSQAASVAVKAWNAENVAAAAVSSSIEDSPIRRRAGGLGSAATPLGARTATARARAERAAASAAGTDLTPNGIAVDSAGDRFIADAASDVVEEVTPSGTESTVAGVPGQSGPPTPGPAAGSELGSPAGLAVDSAGDLFIADPVNDVVEEVTPTGTLSVVAGIPGQAGPPTPGPATSSDLSGPEGVAVDGAGDLYIADAFNGVVEEVTPSGTLSILAGIPATIGPAAPGPATASFLYLPEAVAVDGSGDVFIADTGNHVVEEVSGGTLSIVAGNVGQAGPPTPGPAAYTFLGDPTGLALDGNGNLYIADTTNDAVEAVNLATGNLSIAAGVPGQSGSPTAGPATSSDLGTPADVAVDGTGNLYIADTGDNLVETVDPQGNLSTFAGTGTGAPCPFPSPLTTTFDGSPTIPPAAVCVVGAGGRIVGNVTVAAATSDGTLELQAGGQIQGNVTVDTGDYSRSGVLETSGGTITGTVQSTGALTLGSGTTITGDVEVTGGTLADEGATVDGDVDSDGAESVLVGQNAVIGGDLDVQGTTSVPSSGSCSDANVIGSAQVDGSLQVQGNGAAAPFDIADCGGAVTVGGSLDVEDNAAAQTVGGANGAAVTDDIAVTGNTGGGQVGDNQAEGGCSLEGNAPAFTVDPNNTVGAGEPNGCVFLTTQIASAVQDTSLQAPWSGRETQGASASDTAIVTATTPTVGAPTPAGAVTYTLYDSGDCQGMVLATDQVTLNSDGTVPASSASGPLAVGSFSYQAAYEGDGSYDGSTGPCVPFTVGGRAVRAVVSGVSPASGPPVGGTTITITGTNFTVGAGVTIGQGLGKEAIEASDVQVISSTEITAVTGPGGSSTARDGTFKVYVVTDAGTSLGTATGHFTYVPTPTVTQVSPSSGPLAGGTQITITGNGFDDSIANTSVLIGQGHGAGPGAIPVTIQSISPDGTTIQATTGQGTRIGNWNLYVQTQDGGTSEANTASRFTYTFH